MATSRLTFLYPRLFRSPCSAYKPITQPSISGAHLHGTSRRRDAGRHGSAVEPPPHGVGVPPLSGMRRRGVGGEVEMVKEPEKEQISTPPDDAQPASAAATDVKHPLESTLPPNPSALQSPSYTPPHHTPPPSPHHFDTYTLVQRLTASSLSPALALTIMQSINALLTHHLTHTQTTHITPSHLSNQIYLFTTLLSELKHEILHARHLEASKQRTERARLQHEADLLGQKLTQDLATLRDELKGMFNDRKLAVRLDQTEVERMIQELNYKITVLLGSDMKSEVEGLRWILTRRATMALATMALLILGSLRYSSYVAHVEQQQQQQTKPKQSSDPHPGRESSETLIEPVG